MRKLSFTYYPHVQERVGEVETADWADWVEKGFSEHDVRGKPSDTDSKKKLNENKNGPCLVFGVVEGTRSKAHVKETNAIALDIDDVSDEQLAKALEALDPYTYAAWTTHKSGANVVGNNTRLRIVVPLRKAVPANQHTNVWNQLNHLVGNIVDTSTRDASRLNFLPSTFDIDLAEAWQNDGEWFNPSLLEAVKEDASPVVDENDPFTTNQMFERVKRKLARMSKDNVCKEASRSLLKNQPFSIEGDRHRAIVDLTWYIATRAKEIHLTDEVIRRLFVGSCAVMQHEDPDSPGAEDAVAAYRGAVAKAKDLEKKAREENEQKAQESQLQGKEPLEEKDLQRLADEVGCTLEQLKKRWIIQKDSTFWILKPDGSYSQAVSLTDGRLVAVEYLAQTPVRINDFTSRGLRRKGIAEIAEEYGSAADRVVADLSIQKTVFDAEERTMIEAVTPIRKITPRKNESVAKWLELLGGDQHDKLLDWFAVCPDLTRNLCALYIAGLPGAGKTLIAAGLARIWSKGGATELDTILENFNEELTECPLILGDEALPKTWKGAPITTRLRSIISQTSRTLSRKFRSPVPLRGCVRLILTANNDFLLDSKEMASQEDLSAVAQRFLYVKAEQNAVDYLQQLGRERIHNEWVLNDGLAAHALWLAGQRAVAQGPRFAVEGDVTAMHRMLMTGSQWNALVCEWLVRYCMRPNDHDRKADGLIRIKDGDLLVNEQAIIDGWQIYLSHVRKEPETRNIVRALRALSYDKRPQLRYRGARIRYRCVKIEHLVDWSESSNIGDPEVIIQRMAGSLEEPTHETDDVLSVPAINEDDPV